MITLTLVEGHTVLVNPAHVVTVKSRRSFRPSPTTQESRSRR